MVNLGKSVSAFLIQNPLTSGGGSDPDSSIVDMQGYEGALFLGVVGTQDSTGVCTLKVSEDSSSGGSFNDLSGMTVATSAGESDKLFLINVIKPNDRFLRATITRSAASEYGGTVVLQYGGHKLPSIHTSLGATMIQGITPST